MRSAAGWFAGTTLFALGLILVDRLFWSQCSGLPTSRYGEVWICSGAHVLRIGCAVAGGILAGVLARRRGLLVGVLVGLVGIVLLSLTYRPPVAYYPPAALAAGIALFVVPAALACVAGAKLAGATWRKAIL
jgi:hypothetical protein